MVARILLVAENENDLTAFVRLQGQVDMMRTDGLPAEGNRIAGLAAFDCRGVIPSPICSQERLSLRIEPGQRLRAGKVRKMIAAFAVLGLVINNPVLDFHLPGIQVALQVRRIVLCVP